MRFRVFAGSVGLVDQTGQGQDVHGRTLNTERTNAAECRNRFDLEKHMTSIYYISFRIHERLIEISSMARKYKKKLTIKSCTNKATITNDSAT
jgi:hypothetical protein